jgi:hypothetical protein
MPSKFRPTVERLEDRWTPTNPDPMVLLTDRAYASYVKAYQNGQDLLNLYNSVGGELTRAQDPQAIVSLGTIQGDLDKAQAIVEQEHGLANGMRLVDLAERAYRAHYRRQGFSAAAPLNDAHFRAWSRDFHQWDNWITTVAVPYMNQAQAWVNSQMGP